MSLGGYDFIIEIAQSVLEKMVLGEILNYVNEAEGEEFEEIGELTLPFDFYQEIPIYQDFTAIFHIIVDTPTLQLKANNEILVEIILKKGSISLGNHTFVSRIGGKFEITVPVLLKDVEIEGKENQKGIVANVAGSTVNFAFDTRSRDLISDAINDLETLTSYIPNIPDLPFDFEMPSTITFPSVPEIEVRFANNVTEKLTQAGELLLTSFTVKPGQNGSLEEMIFTGLEMSTIPHSNKVNQALGIYATLLEDSQGNLQQAVQNRVITSEDIRIHLSKKAFMRLTFCPAIAEAFSEEGSTLKVSDLPLSCGAEGNKVVKLTDFGGIVIDSLNLEFRGNEMRVNGSCEVVIQFGDIFEILEFKWGDAGWWENVGKLILDGLIDAAINEITADFVARIELEIDDGNLKPILAEVDVDPDVDIEWYLDWIPVAGIVADVFINWLADEVFAPDAESQFHDQLAASLEGMSGLEANFGDMSISFDSVNLAPDHFFIKGTIEGLELPPAGVPDIEVDWEHKLIDRTVDSVTYSDPDHWCKEVAGKEYTESDIWSTYEVEAFAIPVLLGRPIKYKWWIAPVGVVADDAILTGLSGTVTQTLVKEYSNGECRQEDRTSGPCTLEYEVNHNPLQNNKNGDTVKLRNDPDDGNIFFYLETEATDVEGVKASGFEFIFFNGHTKTGTLEYLQDVFRCRFERVKGEMGKWLEWAEVKQNLRRLNKPQDLRQELDIDRLTQNVAELIDQIEDPKTQSSFEKHFSQAKSISNEYAVAQMSLMLRGVSKELGTGRLKDRLKKLSGLEGKSLEGSSSRP